MAFGPTAGLAIADAVADSPLLKGYPYLPGVRADLLFKLKRFDEAKKEFERAASLTQNASQKKLLLEKASECG
jgi:predicted RNA polymerase sigma factor